MRFPQPMSERGTDIEFDFFDEPPTEEAPRQRRPERTGGPPRPPSRPAGGLTPLLRLVGFVAFGIVLVVLLIWGLQSCRSEGREDAYRDYMDQMRAIARDSQQVGRQLNTVLTTPGIRQQQLQTRLDGLAQQQEQDVTRAREIRPPGRLREQHRNAVEALEFRVSGLRRLQDAFQQGQGQAQGQAQQNDAEVGRLLATQMRRFVASDMIWLDLFMESSAALLKSEEIGGVNVPASEFLGDPEIASAAAMTPIYRRIRGAATGGTPGGKHGNGLISVRALPQGQTLQRDRDNTVVATSDLAFEATVENSGDSQEVRVGVTLTVQQTPRPIVKEATIDLINPGQRKTVVFRDLGQIVQFAQRTQVKVEVKQVRGEENLANNSGTFPVIFTLTG